MGVATLIILWIEIAIYIWLDWWKYRELDRARQAHKRANEFLRSVESYEHYTHVLAQKARREHEEQWKTTSPPTMSQS